MTKCPTTSALLVAGKGGGELGGNVAQDCELLGQLYGNADEGAIGAEELVDLLSHGDKRRACLGS